MPSRNRVLAVAGTAICATAIAIAAQSTGQAPGEPQSLLEGMNWDSPDSDRLRAIGESLPGNPALRSELLQHLKGSPDMLGKSFVARLLARADAAGTRALARQWAASEDAGERAHAFHLWLAFPPDEEGLALARRAAATERDAQALWVVLAALRPVLSPPSPSQAQAVLPLLSRHAAHAFPLVRAHAIQKLAEWDMAGRVVEPAILRGLADESQTVRVAAVGAVMIGSLRTGPVQAALLDVLHDDREDLKVRFAAASALERFPLTEAEHVAYAAARKALTSLAGAGKD